MQTEWSSFFAKLVRDYVAEIAGAEEWGLPEAEDLPLVVRDDTALTKRPCVVFTATAEREAHRHQFRGAVTARILIALTEDGTQAESAADWQASIEKHLDDDVSFFAWVAALDESRRTGWKLLMTPRLMPPGEVETSEDARTQARTVGLLISAAVSRVPAVDEEEEDEEE